MPHNPPHLARYGGLAMGLDLTPGTLAGLFIIDLDTRADEDRPGGSFREVFQAAKLNALGLPQFSPVQWNVSESTAGTLRGFHSEPWNKLVHVVVGRVFACVADVRGESPTVGETWTGELDSSRASFVGAGLANGFQALSDVVVYAYLVDQHWSADVTYPAVAWTIRISRCRGRSPTSDSPCPGGIATIRRWRNTIRVDLPARDVPSPAGRRLGQWQEELELDVVGIPDHNEVVIFDP
jgi:dTDP-4-dehydrorhamnose 3,5-epimerase-like enzyme